MHRLRDHAAIVSRAAVNAVVQTPDEVVEEALHIELVLRAAEAAEQTLHFVSDAVAVGVLRINDVRTRADEHAAAVAEHRRRPGKVIEEDRGFVEFSVAVGILEHANPAELFGAAL